VQILTNTARGNAVSDHGLSKAEMQKNQVIQSEQEKSTLGHHRKNAADQIKSAPSEVASEWLPSGSGWPARLSPLKKHTA
jgi:hypothetical protein